MNTRTVSASQLRAYVDKARVAGASIVGFHAAPVWEDDDGLGDDVVVVPCVSALAVRRALVDHTAADDGRLLVVLTDRDDVGEEALARMWRRGLMHPDAFETLKELFRVRDLAAAIGEHRWLAELLVDVAPVGRPFAPPAGGVLDLDTAWRALLFHGLHLAVERPTLADLLAWAADPQTPATISRFSEADLTRIADRLVEQVGEAARCLLHMVRNGQAEDVVPMGLVCGVLWGSDVDVHAAVQPRTRLEVPLGNHALDEGAARAWGAAAEALTRQAAADPSDAVFATWTSRALQVLDQVGARSLVGASDVIPAGFDARLHAVGDTALAATAAPTPEALEEVSHAAAAVRAHVQATHMPHRVRTVDMVERLVRRHVRGRSGSEPASDLAQEAAAYVGEGAWADEARLALVGGDPVARLGAAAHRLAKAVGEESAESDRTFARALAQWSTLTPSGGDGLIPIEQVMDRAVVPVVAAGAPALVLLLDGLSWAQAHRMFAEIGQRFRRVAPGGSWGPVVSTLPSVTQVSRSSLFAGQPLAGGQPEERDGFASHVGLLDAANGNVPVLFHKADLYAVDGQAAPAVQQAITDPSQRVVGVVVNGADDHLDKGGQLELADGVRALKPLDPLLSWAMEADRVVVVVADHGHVREVGSAVRPAKGGGERWRPAEGDPADDEVLLAGPRVLRGDGRIIAPATEGIRYNATKKLGYHGGATPQEVLCPLAVFTPGVVDVPGWLPAIPQRPAWWDDQPTAFVEVAPLPPSAPPPIDYKGIPTLFSEDNEVPTAAPPSADSPDWIQQLVTSPTYAQQERLAGRQVMDRQAVAHLLAQLDRAGGTLTGEAFTRVVGARARSKADALGKLLNVDGYPVVTVAGSGEVRLDRSLLFEQFGVDDAT